MVGLHLPGLERFTKFFTWSIVTRKSSGITPTRGYVCYTWWHLKKVQWCNGGSPNTMSVAKLCNIATYQLSVSWHHLLVDAQPWCHCRERPQSQCHCSHQNKHGASLVTSMPRIYCGLQLKFVAQVTVAHTRLSDYRPSVRWNLQPNVERLGAINVKCGELGAC